MLSFHKKKILKEKKDFHKLLTIVKDIKKK